MTTRKSVLKQNKKTRQEQRSLSIKLVHKPVLNSIKVDLEIDGKIIKEFYHIWMFFDETLNYYNRYTHRDIGKVGNFLTCDCGFPDCAGYWGFTRIQKKSKTVKLTAKKKYGYTKGVLGGHNNIFDAVVYFNRKEFDKIHKDLLKLVKANINTTFKIGNFDRLTGYDILNNLHWHHNR